MMGSVARGLTPTPMQVVRKRSVCAVVRAEVRAGASDVFEALLKDFADEVDAGEAGCTSYVVTRTFGSRAHFAVHARFRDWVAFRVHGETDHARRVLPRLSALLATPISVELFVEV